MTSTPVHLINCFNDNVDDSAVQAMVNKILSGQFVVRVTLYQNFEQFKAQYCQLNTCSSHFNPILFADLLKATDSVDIFYASVEAAVLQMYAMANYLLIIPEIANCFLHPPKLTMSLHLGVLACLLQEDINSGGKNYSLSSFFSKRCIFMYCLITLKEPFDLAVLLIDWIEFVVQPLVTEAGPDSIVSLENGIELLECADNGVKSTVLTIVKRINKRIAIFHRGKALLSKEKLLFLINVALRRIAKRLRQFQRWKNQSTTGSIVSRLWSPASRKKKSPKKSNDETMAANGGAVVATSAVAANLAVAPLTAECSNEDVFSDSESECDSLDVGISDIDLDSDDGDDGQGDDCLDGKEGGNGEVGPEPIETASPGKSPSKNGRKKNVFQNFHVNVVAPVIKAAGTVKGETNKVVKSVMGK